MTMGPETSGYNPDIDRSRVDFFKSKILEAGVFDKQGGERNAAAARVIDSLDITGVRTIDNLYEKTKDKSVSQTVALNNIRNLGRAIGEVILDKGDGGLKAALVAGSYTLESVLPKPWKGSVEDESGEDVGLASVVCDSIYESRLIDGNKRDEVRRVMETVDYLKESKEFSGLVGDSVDQAIKTVSGLIDPRRKNEAAFLSERLVYLKSFESKSGNNSNLDGVVEKISKAVDSAIVNASTGSEDVDMRAVVENKHGDGKEYRSPYEVTRESFVDSIFNYEDPRLFFTPPPEWVKAMSPEAQYLLKIQQKLAKGASYKLGVKNIDAAKARQNEVYDLPTAELKLLYEMPHMKEALENFMDLFEFYSEDGRRFLRLKLSIKDGVLEVKDGKPVLDATTAKNLGDVGTDDSFENYKEKMFRVMALKRIYKDKISEIDVDWKGFYKKVISDYITEARKDPKNNGKSDAKLEYEWISRNALEEKRAVATAWNFLFVGNTIESADIYRHLKPTQINSDKIRTMMMPLEKFLQKGGYRGSDGQLRGDEELFSRVSLFTKRMTEDQGVSFVKKIIYAADHDRQSMTKEELQWRVLPKRMMCSFADMYVVETEDKSHMTFSEALMSKKKMVFKDDDADVFVFLRDTWDEVISMTPFLIGKGEYTPTQQPDKFAAMVEKWRGLVTSINNIRLTDAEEISKRRVGLASDKLWKADFGHEGVVEYPEFYAWFLANTIGLRLNLDTPILDMSALKANKDTYNNHVDNLIGLLDLKPNQAVEVRRILNATNWWSARNAITSAERRAAMRETNKRKEEKRSK